MSATFKTGDRVRCTLGDSVLVGVVMHNSVAFHLNVDGSSSWSVPLRRPWKVEVIPPPERNWQPGDVVRDAKGLLFVRDDGCWRVANQTSWHADSFMERPLTLLVPAEDGAS